MEHCVSFHLCPCSPSIAAVVIATTAFSFLSRLAIDWRAINMRPKFVAELAIVTDLETPLFFKLS
jgi:hypothetical protein